MNHITNKNTNKLLVFFLYKKNTTMLLILTLIKKYNKLPFKKGNEKQ